MGVTPQVFGAGSFVFHEGDVPDAVFLVESGLISIRKKKDGGFIEIGRIQPNEVVGELSFFDQRPRSASAMALSTTKVLKIDFESLEAAFSKMPSYFRTIVAQIADRLRKANEQLKHSRKNIVEGAEVDTELTAPPSTPLTTDMSTDDLLQRLDAELDSKAKKSVPKKP